MPALQVITQVDEQLLAAGLVSYADLLRLLNESAKLGLTFDIGTAYIRRTHIDQQDALLARIKAANTAVQDEALLAELARPLTATEQELVDEIVDGPMTKTPLDGAPYWVAFPNTKDVTAAVWGDGEADEQRLAEGRCYSTEAAAWTAVNAA